MRIKLIAIIVAAFCFGASAAMLLRSVSGYSLKSAVQPQVSGKALIGGPFSLIDHSGKRVTEKDFLGKSMLVYFGYTYCPDICPSELQVISTALDQLGDKEDKITPVFITIDPERDTVSQMADYMANFHKNFIGLTGSKEEIRVAAKAFRVYYAKVKDEGSEADYLMDHTSIIYLLDGNGSYVTHFPYGTSAEKIANRLAEHL